MIYKIFSRWDGTKVLFEREGNSLREVVTVAVASDAYLRDAYLSDAYLRDPSIERIPSFHCSNDAAMEDMKMLAEKEAAR